MLSPPFGPISILPYTSRHFSFFVLRAVALVDRLSHLAHFLVLPPLRAALTPFPCNSALSACNSPHFATSFVIVTIIILIHLASSPSAASLLLVHPG